MGIALSAGRGENHGDSHHDPRSTSATGLSTLLALSHHLHPNELLRDADDDADDDDGFPADDDNELLRDEDDDEIGQDWVPSSLAGSSSSPPHFSHSAPLSGRYNHHYHHLLQAGLRQVMNVSSKWVGEPD